MRPNEKVYSVKRIRGRNGFDDHEQVPQDMALEVLNMDFYEGGMGRKRGGLTDVGITFSAGGPFSNEIVSLIRHVPGIDAAAAELWAIDNTGQICRLSGAATWTEPTRVDNAAGGSNQLFQVHATSFNGRMPICYDTSVNRMHLWDPVANKIRRAGLATPAVVTIANTGSGSYAATIRYYKVAYTVQISGTTVRRSELSAVASFTPSGSGTHARVTKPATISEDETHWELYASADNLTFYLIATTVVGTTTYDDNATPSAYTGDDEPVAGINTVPVSARFVITDGNRLIYFGTWEASTPTSRVWFTPLLGSSDIGDDERIPNTTTQKNWIDLDEHDSGIPSGLGGPLDGVIFAFKTNSIHALIPTGNVSTPFSRITVTKERGCLAERSITLGRDQHGAPCLYFLSHDGPCRIGANGLEWLGADVQDIWSAFAFVSQGDFATDAIFYGDRNQWWLALYTSESSVVLVFDVTEGRPVQGEGVRGGWAKWNFATGHVTSLALFEETIGSSMSGRLVPYVGDGDTEIYRYDESATSDSGSAFQAYVDLPPRQLGGGIENVRITQPQIVAEAASGVTLTVTATRDFGVESATGTALLTASGSETHVRKKVEGLELQGGSAFAFRIGDAAPVAGQWTLDQLYVPFTVQERA